MNILNHFPSGINFTLVHILRIEITARIESVYYDIVHIIVLAIIGSMYGQTKSLATNQLKSK